jgi:hypothetical protein
MIKATTAEAAGDVLSNLERSYRARPDDFTHEEDVLLLELMARAKKLEEELVANWRKLRKG